MIYELLLEGKENKRSTQELIDKLNIDKRAFYNILRQERREGRIILSTKENGGGYWLWNGEDIQELKRYYKMHKSGAIDILSTLKPVYAILKEHNKES